MARCDRPSNQSQIKPLASAQQPAASTNNFPLRRLPDSSFEIIIEWATDGSAATTRR